jgi:hypothetical protein
MHLHPALDPYSDDTGARKMDSERIKQLHAWSEILLHKDLIDAYQLDNAPVIRAIDMHCAKSISSRPCTDMMKIYFAATAKIQS